MLETLDELLEKNNRQRQIIALLESELGRWKQLANDMARGVASIAETHEDREEKQVEMNTDYLSARELAHKHTG
jgi:hypothetical protein